MVCEEYVYLSVVDHAVAFYGANNGMNIIKIGGDGKPKELHYIEDKQDETTQKNKRLSGVTSLQYINERLFVGGMESGRLLI